MPVIICAKIPLAVAIVSFPSRSAAAVRGIDEPPDRAGSRKRQTQTKRFR